MLEMAFVLLVFRLFFPATQTIVQTREASRKHGIVWGMCQSLLKINHATWLGFFSPVELTSTILQYIIRYYTLSPLCINWVWLGWQAEPANGEHAILFVVILAHMTMRMPKE
jgi:hypothetical protein